MRTIHHYNLFIYFLLNVLISHNDYTLYKRFYNMSQIILDPMTILGMSNFYEKKIVRKMGATLGLLYAQQV